MKFDNILFQVENRVLTITVNRPDKLNALTTHTIRELNELLAAYRNDNNINAVVITGAGEKAFVAGADISEFADFDAEQGRMLSRNGHQLLFNYIENYSKPIIAAINGFALGGGFELALSCHIRVASDNARMGFPEVTLGVIPGYGGTQRLAQLAGKGKALELILTADMIKAQEAFDLGLLNAVVPQADLMNKVYEICEKIKSKSPVAISHAIVAINANYKDGVDGFAVEIEEFGKCFENDDFREGTKAFLEKRKPDFKGKLAQA
ncbi:MAG: enoyl-CoA hydratase/isomerase family protein [Bacteroidia bacterium]|nr:enoyl-CoA hydratase/isomerase family protein [Bacteroidia bacterium]MCZ2249689.1 enoyl-CoA hydratase/isomerase family protein [Bacteroidia bacterium]